VLLASSSRRKGARKTISIDIRMKVGGVHRAEGRHSQKKKSCLLGVRRSGKEMGGK